MPLTPGQHLGPYEILGSIGAGGMGEVYRARDPRLGRDVALKVAAEQFNERFGREARAIAALNHPNICTLHDVGPNYLVMELVEGAPLISRERPGPMPLEEALPLANQILDALIEAHGKGITHRDLKPGNILVNKNGVKVLDFGLAKFASSPAPDDATRTTPLTGDGSILGTIQYMAPEQLEGKPADARSDLFAFGLIFYEMLTGTRAFTGATQASLVASILKDPPKPVSELQPLAPRALERLVATCLEKNPEKRWQSAREIKHALAWAMENSTQSRASGGQAANGAAPGDRTATTPSLRWLPWVAALLGVTTLLALWAPWRANTITISTAAPLTRLTIVPPGNIAVTNISGSAISPDGRTLAFVSVGTGAQAGQLQLFIRALDSLEVRAIPGTDSAQRPFWSPDSKTVGFFKENQLLRADLAGGGVQLICAISQSGRGGTWNSDGVILFADQNDLVGIKRVSASGGQPTPITGLDAARGENSHYYPQFLPDGKHFLYFRRARTSGMGIYVGVLDDPQKGKADKLVVASESRAVYAPSASGAGHLLIMQSGSLTAQPFDPATLALSGEATPIATGLHAVEANAWFDGSASNTGVLAYGTGENDRVMRWLDRSGKVLSNLGESISAGAVRLSPDGRRVTGFFNGKERQGHWIFDFERNTRTRLTFEPSTGAAAVWSPDSSQIAYRRADSGAFFVKSTNGAGDVRELKVDIAGYPLLTDWTRDGRLIFSSSQDIFAMPEAGGASQPLVQGPATQGQGHVSPDGRWLAYQSNESGAGEIFVVGLGEVKGKWQVSDKGGFRPHWRADGRELVYLLSDSSLTLVAVPVETSGAGIRLGKPQALGVAASDYDLTADHQRILASQRREGQQNAPFVILQNWQQLVK